MTIHNSLDVETTLMSIREWTKKTWYILKMECYSATKKNKIMLFTGIQMDLQTVILSEISQRRRNIV